MSAYPNDLIYLFSLDTGTRELFTTYEQDEFQY